MFMRPIFIALLLSISVELHAGELLDRIVATVNGQVILQSDWDDEVHFEAFMSGRAPENVTAEQRKAALDRLVDQDILREQMRMTDLKPASDDAIKKQIDDVKNEQLREHPGQSWETTLSRYQLTDKVVKDHVAAELEQLQLVDLRFRPSIQISSADIEKYYRQKIVPKLPASDPLSLNDAVPKIKEILIQERINQLLNSWLETLRSQAQIKVLSADKSSDASPSMQETR
jgi:peptidyl-prolyl cis-trans isomerase SurA